MTLSEAHQEIAELVVLWDGASEDGCVMCGADYVGDSPYPNHFAECPIPVVRLAMIEKLMDGDPAPESHQGKRLVALTKAQEIYEQRALRPPAETPQ